MKTIKLITFKLMLLVLTTTMFINCESDTALDTQDEVLNVAKEAPFSSRLVYTSEIESNSIISDKLRGINQNRNNASFENDNNAFSVETDVAKYVEKSDGSGYSYTFAISRDNGTSTELENLVLSVNTNTQELSTVIMKYQYTAIQLQELLSTGHVSTSHETIVTPIEGDFSDLLVENNSLPCTISVTTYHITPDGGTHVYGQNSQCQHIIDPDSGETECEVYNVVSIWCPPTTTGGSGTTTTTTNNPNSSGDPTNNTTNGGTTTPPNTNDPNNNDKDEVVTTPMTKLEMQELSDQLDEEFGEGNWDFEGEPIEDAPNFESVDEAAAYLQSLLNDESTPVSSDMEIGQENIRKDVNKLKFSGFPRADLVTTVKLVQPAQDVALEVADLRNVITELEGNTSLFDWTQTDSNDPNASDQSGPTVSIYPNISSMVIEIDGHIKIGLNIEGNPVRVRTLITVSINYNYTTGEMQHQYCRWLFR